MKFYSVAIILSILINYYTVNGAYYGKLVGPLSKATNSYHIAGKVYIADSNHLFIEDFEHDGKGPGVRYWIGLRKDGSNINTVLNKGQALLDENGSSNNLKKYDKKTVYLTLPSGVTFDQVAYFSIWCATANVNFGHVEIPSNFAVPAKKSLGSFGFSPAKSGVKASDVILENIQKITVKQFEFSGGSNIYFGVMTGDYNNAADVSNAVQISQALTTANKVDKSLDLPGSNDVRNFKHFIVYNSQTREVLGQTSIPTSLNIPPKPPGPTVNPPPPPNEHCKQILSNVAVSYKLEGSDLVVTVDGALADDEYIAFGPSGSNSGVAMVNGDVVAVYMVNGQAKAVDYFLGSKAQCSSGNGVCPDKDVTSGQSNVELVSGKKDNGKVTIKYKRKLSTGDTKTDRTISAGSDMYFIWAKGKYNDQEQILFHSSRGGYKTNLGNVQSDCTGKTQPTDPPKRGFKEIEISGVTEFDVTLGDSGGSQGYTAITKTNSWGIAYYINGKLIPVLRLQPDVLYTFNIFTGNDTAVDPEYHPFYITDDPKGNYRGYTADERKKVNVYAGLDSNGNPIGSALGTYCSYKKKAGANGVYDSFDQFAKDLTKECKHNPTKKGQFKFTPTSALVGKQLYYQCYAHNYLGWKITVGNSSNKLVSTTTGFLLSIFVFIVRKLF